MVGYAFDSVNERLLLQNGHPPKISLAAITSGADGLLFETLLQSKRWRQHHWRWQQLNQLSAASLVLQMIVCMCVWRVHRTLIKLANEFVTKNFERNLLLIWKVCAECGILVESIATQHRDVKQWTKLVKDVINFFVRKIGDQHAQRTPNENEMHLICLNSQRRMRVRQQLESEPNLFSIHFALFNRQEVVWFSRRFFSLARSVFRHHQRKCSLSCTRSSWRNSNFSALLCRGHFGRKLRAIFA